MSTTDQHVDPQAALHEALAAFQGEVPDIPRDDTVNLPGRRYRFQGLAPILKQMRPFLAKNGLSVSWEYGAEEGTVSVTCWLRHRAGGVICSTLKGKPPKNLREPEKTNFLQATGTVCTYLRRYTVCSVLGIEPDDDADGQEDTSNVTAKGTAGVSPARATAEAAKKRTSSKGESPPPPPPAPVQEDEKYDDIPF